MSSENSHDMIEADAYSVDELREAVFEGPGRLSRPLALSLLAKKDYPAKVRDLERLLTNEQEAPRLRALAAQALGEIGSAPAVRALERGLETQEGVTLRAVARALAPVGARKHVGPLRELARRSDVVGREAERALDVLTRRVGRPNPEPPGPAGGNLGVERRQRWTEIETRRPAARDLRRALDDVPTPKLTREGALALHCQGRDLLLLFGQDARRQGLDVLRKRGELGVVAERRTIEQEAVGWEERYRVAVEPEGRGRFRLVVTTHDGRPVLHGEGQVVENEAEYRLVAVEAPGALPIEIHGRFDGRRVRLEEARSAERRRPSRTPLGLHRR